MANKKRVQRSIKQLQRVKTWQLVILLILAAFIAATFLRLNNIGMDQRRKAVLSADEVGDTRVMQERLYDLQRFVSAHMNTDMEAGIYLEHQYDRDRQKIIETASDQQTSSGNIYKDADTACRALYSRYSAYYQCFIDKINADQGVANPQTKIALPSANTYKQNFASPLWSPDFAGWSIVVCLVIVLIIVTRLTSLGVLRIMLRHHYRSV